MDGTAPLFEQYFKEHQPVGLIPLFDNLISTLTALAGGWLDQERPVSLDRQRARMVQDPRV